MPRSLLLALMWLAAFNCRAPLVAAGPLLPLVLRDLHLSATAAAGLTALPLLLMAALSVPAGLLNDRVGPVPVLLLSQLGIAVAGGLRGLLTAPILLLVLSALLGVGISLSQPALARLARAVPGGSAGATSVYATGMLAGALAAVSASATVLLAALHTWQAVFLFWGALGLAPALGWTVLTRNGLPGAERPAASRRAGPGWVVPGLWPVAVAFGAQALVFYGLVTWLPEYYVSQGWRVGQASLPISALSLSSIPAALLTPRLVHGARGYRRGLVVAGAVTTVGVLGVLGSAAGAVLWGSLIGIGTSLAFTLCLAAAAELAPAERVGAATGTVLTAGQLAAVAGPLVLGVLRDATGGFTAGWVGLVAVSLGLGAAGLATPARPTPAVPLPASGKAPAG